MPPKRAASKAQATVVGDGPSPPKVVKKGGKKEVAEVAPTVKKPTAKQPTVERPKRGATKPEAKLSVKPKEEKPKRGAKKETPQEKEEEKVSEGPSTESSVGKSTIKLKNGEQEEPVKENKTKPTKKDATEKGERPKRGAKKETKNMNEEKSEEQEEINEETVPKKPAKGKKTVEKPVPKPKKTAAKKKGQEAVVEATNGDATKSSAKLLNNSETQWDKIDFSSEKKNAKGQECNLKITSWNVSGARAWVNKGGLDIFKYDSPDIMCFQEFKCSEDKLPEALKDIEGYKGYRAASEKEGYAGVAVYSKNLPIEVRYGIGNDEFDKEGRCITLEYEKFFLVNVYVPNAGRGLKTLDKRMDWNELFKTYIKSLDEKKPVILCGDMNVAHEEIDLANPKTNTKSAGFTPQEREGLTEFLKDGYVDTFRKLHPDTKGAYTFWTYMGKSRSKNVGWRLDYFIISSKLFENVCDCVIRDSVFGSDHCPVSLFISI